MEKTSPPGNQPDAIPGRTDLSRYDNSWFKPGPRWKILLWFIVNSLTLNTYLPLPVSLKRFILTVFGARLGTAVMIKPGVNIKYPWLLSIGSNVWIGEEVWIDNLCPVTIEDNVCLSQGAMLLTGNHDYRRPTFDLIVRPITLRSGVWIGARAVVCPGVEAGSHAVLAVGSIATRALEPYGVYQGNPAVRVRERAIDA